ncbi:hypothetical protein ACFXAE_33800 [Streptomyces sp. NPDC059454]|uniref:hypothetical protein n=1 Tax=Streptomyces sp. NPDC059454 TaxID=3346836 RepID=UPI0036B68F3D
MTVNDSAVPGQALAREIFGPLGGVVEIGAVAATGTWDVARASVVGLVSRHRGEVDRLLVLVREIGRFSEPSMAIVDELGWLREHPVTAPSLLLWAVGIEEIPPRLEDLEQPRAVRRMCYMGADLQLTRLLQAMVTAAAVAGRRTAADSAGKIAEALDVALLLANRSDPAAAATVFRMWRTACLPDILRPDSDATAAGRSAFRSFAHALEDRLDP